MPARWRHERHQPSHQRLGAQGEVTPFFGVYSYRPSANREHCCSGCVLGRFGPWVKRSDALLTPTRSRPLPGSGRERAAEEVGEEWG